MKSTNSEYVCQIDEESCGLGNAFLQCLLLGCLEVKDHIHDDSLPDGDLDFSGKTFYWLLLTSENVVLNVVDCFSVCCYGESILTER